MNYYKCPECKRTYSDIDLLRDLVEENGVRYFKLTHCPYCYELLVQENKGD